MLIKQILKKIFIGQYIPGSLSKTPSYTEQTNTIRSDSENLINSKSEDYIVSNINSPKTISFEEPAPIINGFQPQQVNRV